MLGIQGEQILFEVKNTSIVLTTHRVHQEGKSWGASQAKSIMLEDVASYSYGKISYPILLILAGVFLVTGIVWGIADSRNAAAAIGAGAGACVLCVLLYFGSRRDTLVIASAGQSIISATQGIEQQYLDQFMLSLTAAKDQRYRLLFANPQTRYAGS